eukprot:g9241.t1
MRHIAGLVLSELLQRALQDTTDVASKDVRRVEKSRQRELIPKERFVVLQQEVARLQVENRRLKAQLPRAPNTEEEPANWDVSQRLAEENRKLLAEKERLLLEVSRVARDNQRLRDAQRGQPDVCDCGRAPRLGARLAGDAPRKSVAFDAPSCAQEGHEE